MTYTKVSLILIVTMALGYFESYSAYYVKLFQHDTLQIHGSLSEYNSNCEKTSEHSICSNRYVVPKDIHRGGPYLGSGIIISSSRYFCEGAKNQRIEFDDPKNPGKIFDLVNTYQMVNSSSLNCNGNLVVEAWSPPTFRRSGYQGGALVSGPYEAVNRVKKITELVTRDIYRLFFIVFIFAWGVFSVMKKYGLISFESQIFYPFMWCWVLYLFSATDLFEAIFPYTGLSNIMRRSVAVFSLLAHLSPVLLLFLAERFRKYQKNHFFLGTAIGSLVIATVLLDWWGVYFGFFCLAIFLYVFEGVRLRKVEYVAFGFVTSLTILKVMGVPYMPSGRTTTIFFGLYISIFIFQKIKKVIGENFDFAHRERILEYELENERLNVNMEKNIALFSLAKLVAHDLRGPLEVLKTLKNIIPNGDGRTLYETSLERISRISSDVLETNKEGRSLPCLDVLNRVIEGKQIVNNYELKADLNSLEGVHLKAEFISGIERSFSNLLQNAIEGDDRRFMPIEIEASLDNYNLDLSISNSSKTLSQETLNKLNSGVEFTTKDFGNGLGASSSKRIISKMGGSIDYTMNKEHLVTCRITLPKDCFVFS